MSIESITTAYNGLKMAKDIFTGITDAKIETDSISKINEAVKKVGDAQDALFQLREELFTLQEENNKLQTTINESNEWASRLNNYELVETSGGAVVYKSLEGTGHYICPTCKEKKEIHILQNNRTVSGKYRCVNCQAEFPVNEKISTPTPTIKTAKLRW